MTAFDPAPVPAPTAGEPTTLRELYLRAQADLKAPTAGMYLRWVFLHATFVGKLEIARAVMKRAESEVWENQQRQMAALPSETMRDMWAAREPHPSVLLNAEERVSEAAAFVDATARVVDMLEAATRPPVRSVR